MTDLTDPPSPGRALEPVITPWRSAPDEVWERVREDYLAGLSAPACARRHGVGVSTLRERAAREGWRRADQPWPSPAPLYEDDEGRALEASVDGAVDRIEAWKLSEITDLRMIRAVLRGDAAGALRWRRVRDALDEDAADIQRMHDEDAAYRARISARPAVPAPPDGLDGLDGSDGVFPPSGA